MSNPFDEPPGATPLDPDERAGLIPTSILTRGDLNEVEEQNILRAEAWARRQRRDVLTEPFVRALHKQMFSDVWRWAGSYRRSGKNIGIDWREIPHAVPEILDQVRHWVERQTFSPDEIGVRFHHRLTQIHPFPNGNGRHARLIVDLLTEQSETPLFSWGSGRLESVSDLRRAYIEALRAADAHDLVPLLKFVRS